MTDTEMPTGGSWDTGKPLLLSHLKRDELEAKCAHHEWERDYWFRKYQELVAQLAQHHVREGESAVPPL